MKILVSAIMEQPHRAIIIFLITKKHYLFKHFKGSSVIICTAILINALIILKKLRMEEAGAKKI